MADWIPLMRMIIAFGHLWPRLAEFFMTLIMACATVAVAVLTYRTWRVYVQMAQIMSVAQRREWMPLIELKPGPGGSSGKHRWTNFELRNVGRGYALDIRAVYYTRAGTKMLMKAGDLAPGEENEIKLEYENGGSPFAEAESRLEVSFKDVFGNEFSVCRSDLGLQYRLDE